MAGLHCRPTSALQGSTSCLATPRHHITHTPKGQSECNLFEFGVEQGGEARIGVWSVNRADQERRLETMTRTPGAGKNLSLLGETVSQFC